MDPLLDLLNLRPRPDWQWQFDATAAGHSPVNALALCNLSILAYSDEPVVSAYLARWNLSLVQPLRGHRGHGLIARDDDAILIAFRGTDPVNADDWFSDVNCHQRALGRAVPGSVHGGFATVAEELVRLAANPVNELLQNGARQLFITGHSLGGAIAILAASILKFDEQCQVAGVYTYGQPRVGDDTFSAAYNRALGSTFRYVNDMDLVPHLPPVRLWSAPRVPTPESIAAVLQNVPDIAQNLRTALGSITAAETVGDVGQLKLLIDGAISNDPRAWQERDGNYSQLLLDVLSGPAALRCLKLSKQLQVGHRLLDHDPLHGYVPQLEAIIG